MPTLSELYQRELAYYRELLGEFSEQHPEVAHMVDGREADASVERLLQGAALLSGFLRSRIEDPFSEIIQPLCASTWPQRLRPTPPLLSLQAKPEVQAGRKVVRLPRGTPFTLALTQPEGPRRELAWTTCTPLEMPPATLEQAETLRVGPADSRFRLRFSFTGGQGFAGAGLSHLRLHFVGPALRHRLYLLLVHKLRGVALEDEHGARQLWIEPSAVRPIGFTEDETLIPGWPATRPGLRALFEYFDLEAKFLGVELHGLGRVPPGIPGDSFQLVFHLGAEPDLPPIDPGDFALGRVYAVNLSTLTRLSPGPRRGASGCVLEHAGQQAFTIEAVGCSIDGKLERLLEATSQAKLHGAQPLSYEIEWADDVHGIVSPHLRLLQGAIPASGEESAEVIARMWDRELAARASTPGTLSPSTRAGPFELEVTGSVIPPRFLGSARLEALWTAMAELMMHPNDLCSVNGLSRLVREARSGREGVGLEPEILAMRNHVGARVHCRTVVPVREVEVDLAERSFASAGQLFLFARVLSELFRRQGDSPAFWGLTVRAQPSGTCYRFGPQ